MENRSIIHLQTRVQMGRARYGCATDSRADWKGTPYGHPGPAYLDLPGDILYTQLELGEVLFPRNLPKQPRPAGDPELIEEAVALLRHAKRPLILSY